MFESNINKGKPSGYVPLNAFGKISDKYIVNTSVSGGTYSGGTATFINSTGGTFDVTGFYTNSDDIFVTGGTYDQNTGISTFVNSTGGTFDVTGFYTGYTSYWYAQNEMLPVISPIASGTSSVAIGDGAEALSNDMFVAGSSAGVGVTGQKNNFIGYYAGNNATSVYNSNFIGVNAGQNATYANKSTFIGHRVGESATNAYHSVFIGRYAGNNATDAHQSNFFGDYAGQNALYANNSNFLGTNAGNSASSAFQSNFFGQNAGFAATNANDSNFLGFQAGLNATNAYQSNFLGQNAGNDATSANGSNFLGFQAGQSATNSSNSNFLGYQAGQSATNSSNSNFLGYQAGQNAANAYYSNFIGNQAGQVATNAYYSNFFGNQAGFQATNAYFSNFFGSQAGYNATDAYFSNFFGSQAGFQATNAYYSNLIGYNAGYASSTSDSIGSNNIIIGTNITLSAGTIDSINIGNVLYGINTYSFTGGNPSTTPQSTGRIGIGVVTPTKTLHVYGESANDSGLRLERLTSSSPTSTGQTIGVDISGNVVTIASSGGGASVIEKTADEIISLQNTNTLQVGSLYKIVGFNKNMPTYNGYIPNVLYDDGTNSGITIYSQAITTNTLSATGWGQFYNPKYIYNDFNPLTVSSRTYDTFRNALNGAIGSYVLSAPLVMHVLASDNYYLLKFSSWTYNGEGGGFSYTRQLITPAMDSPIIAFVKTNYGNEVDIVEAGVLEITRGLNGPIYNVVLEGSSTNDSPLGTEWSALASPYGNTDGTGLYGIWDGDNPEPTEVPIYVVDQVVFWGGYAWKNLNGNVGNRSDILTLNSGDWQKLPYSASTYYESVIDEIKIDWNNRIIVGRTNIENQITVEFNADSYAEFSIPNALYNPIAVMGWGIYSTSSVTGIYNGIANVNVSNGVCETVNFKGLYFLNIKIDSSILINNYFGKNSYFTDNTLNQDSFFNNNTLSSGSYIKGNTLSENSYIDGNTLSQSSYLMYNTLNQSTYFTSNTLSVGSYFLNNSLNQFGYFNLNILSENSNIRYNTLSKNCFFRYNNLSENSYFELNTLSQSSSLQSNTLSQSSYIQDNTLSESSYFNNNTLSNSSYFELNTLAQNSYFNNNTLSSTSAFITNTLTNSSFNSNTLTNSYFQSNTLTNSYFQHNTLSVGSNLGNNTLSNSYFDYNILIQNSYFGGNILSQNSTINYNNLSGNSYFINNTLSEYSNFINNFLNNISYFAYNTLSESSDFNFITSGTLNSKTITKVKITDVSFTEDISLSTIIYLDTTKTIFKRLDGTKRLSYYDTSDTPIIVNVNS